jgi:hypothetical protein
MPHHLHLPTRFAAGVAAGTLATGAMSAVMLGAKKAGLLGKMPPKKIAEWALGKISPLLRHDSVSKPVSLLAHFGYGAGAGGLFGIFTKGARPSGPVALAAKGSLYGLAVWAASYLGWVPAMNIMPRATRDRRDRQISMAIAHIVFGATLGALLSLTERSAARG